MPQPNPYTRDFDFTRLAPAEVPEVGARLNGEFDDLTVRVDEIRDSFRQIQRDDGLLANGSVHPDALSARTRSLIVGGWELRGNWTTGAQYAVRDVVAQGGVFYVALVAHVSGVFATDLAAGRWLVWYQESLAPADGSVSVAKLAAGFILPQASLPNVLATGSTTPRALAARYGAVAHVRDFGAVGNGTTDDTAAFQAAFATGRRVVADDGTFRITASLTFSANGQSFTGAGQNRTILLPQGNFDVLVAPPPLDHVSAEGFSINGAGLTGGYCLSVTGADRVEFRHIRINSPWRVAYVFQCNAYTAEDVYVQAPRGGMAWHLYGEDPNRSDVIRLRDINVGSATKSPAWTGIYWDGFVNTVQSWGVTFVNCDRGLHVVNSGGGTLPLFGIFYDLEIDFCSREAVLIEAGSGFWFNFLYAQGSDTTELVRIGSAVDSVRIDHGYIRGAFKEGIVVGGQDVTVSATQIVFNSFPAANYFNFDAVRVLGTAQRVNFIGCNIGQLAGIGATVRYGAVVEAGANSVRFVGCDFSGTLMGDLLDQSGGPAGNVELVGCYANGRVTNEFVSGFEYGTGTGRGATLTPTVTSGSIPAVAVTTGGEEYTVAPVIAAFDPLGTGSGFVATATVSGGVVTLITVTNPGSGYSANTRVVAFPAARAPTLKARFPGNVNIPARIEADGTGVVQFGNDQGTGAQVSTPANAVNFPQLVGAVTGAPALVEAAGADANVNLRLAPKGTGVLNLGGTTVGTAGAITLYLNVQVNGVAYKLPLYAV